jgi:phosphate-selective porin OprO and OprP
MTHGWVKGLALATIVGALLAAGRGHAQTIKQLERQIEALQQNYQNEIQDLQQQVQLLKRQQAKQAAQAEATRLQATKAAEAARRGPHVVETKGHEFGLESADGLNAIYLTGRIHFDVGGYLNYARKTANAPLELSDGANVRRARIGVVGKFMGDWDYGLIYDFGGSTDSVPVSGIENAYLIYNGFYRHHEQFPVAIDFGVIDVPWTLDETISANDILFMERSSAQVIATEFGGGDSRTAFGLRSNSDRYFLGVYLTGPTTGALHTYTTGTCPPTASPDDCTGPQLAFLARGSYQLIQTDEGSLHFGLDFGDLFRPRGSTNLETITLTDRPELRIDPTDFIGTGAMPASGGMVLGVEAAGAYENAFIEGEYYHYSIDRIGLPGVDFNGGYVQASYSLGGRRHYKAGAGSYTGVIPENPLSFSTGGWGALELAARYSVIDLNDTSVASPVYGGDQQTYGIGLNYYPNDNMRFMLDFDHVNITVPGGTTAKGASFDTIAARTQIDF